MQLNKITLSYNLCFIFLISFSNLLKAEIDLKDSDLSLIQNSENVQTQGNVYSATLTSAFWIHFKNSTSEGEGRALIQEYRLLSIDKLSNPLRYLVYDSSEDLSFTKRLEKESLVHSIDNSSVKKFDEDYYSSWENKQQNLKKNTWILGAGSFTLMTLWGSAAWNWGKEGTRFGIGGEGWLNKNSYSGGADKFGHMYSLYFQKRTLHWILVQMGWDFNNANLISALIAEGLGVALEIGDGFTEYRFAADDLVFDTLGVLAAYFLDRYPFLDELIGLRWEWWPGTEYRNKKNNNKLDFSSDYNGMKFYLSLKAAGIKVLSRPWYSRYLTLDLGYYTRGYKSIFVDNSNIQKFGNQYWSIGMGLNLSTLLFDIKPHSDWSKVSSTLFKYWIPPGVTYGVNSKL